LLDFGGGARSSGPGAFLPVSAWSVAKKLSWSKDLAEDIVENIEAGLNNFRTVLAALGK